MTECEIGDRHGPARTLTAGIALFGLAYLGLAYLGLAFGPDSVAGLIPWFLAAGIAIGCVETAEHAAVATLAPVELRGSAFGLLAAVQSLGNLRETPQHVRVFRRARVGPR